MCYSLFENFSCTITGTKHVKYYLDSDFLHFNINTLIAMFFIDSFLYELYDIIIFLVSFIACVGFLPSSVVVIFYRRFLILTW